MARGRKGSAKGRRAHAHDNDSDEVDAPSPSTRAKVQPESLPSPCESELSGAGTPTDSSPRGSASFCDASPRNFVGCPCGPSESSDAHETYDIVIVGTGPHGLSMLSALHEPNSRDVLSEKEFNRKHCLCGYSILNSTAIFSPECAHSRYVLSACVLGQLVRGICYPFRRSPKRAYAFISICGSIL